VTIRAERPPLANEGAELIAAERQRGVFSRQLMLGDSLDLDRVEATYDAGVLTLRFPVAEKAKPKKISITNGRADRKEISV